MLSNSESFAALTSYRSKSTHKSGRKVST
uniref:Uncharacterized protein n=1 Tax=Arundo donax TaxID=35708 RepID=A0A0A9HR28_ARUDO